MRYCNLDFSEMEEWDKEQYDNLHEWVEELEKMNVLEIIHDYGFDFEYIIVNDEFYGAKILIDPTYKIYLEAVGIDGTVQTEDGKYYLDIKSELSNAIYETFKIFLKHGVKRGNILSA